MKMNRMLIARVVSAVLVTAVLVTTLTLGVATAQEDKSKGPNQRAGGKAARGRTVPVVLPAFTREREAAVRRFVKQHQRELVDVLEGLKSEDEPGYHRAIGELYRNSERISGYKKRGDNERYRIELELWKIDNRIRLLTAQMSMATNTAQGADSRKEELRKLFLQKNDWQVKRYELDIQRTAIRLKRLSETLRNLQEHREELADRAVEQQLRAGKSGKRPRRPRPKSVDTKTGGPTTDKNPSRTGQR